MKKEHNNNEMPSPEDFWPEAKALLDGHFAKRKKLFLYFGTSLVFIISAIGLVLMNQNKKADIANLEKAKTELISKQVLLKNTTINNSVKADSEAPIVNKSSNPSPKIERQNTADKSVEKSSNAAVFTNTINNTSAKLESQAMFTKNDPKRNDIKNDYAITASIAEKEFNSLSIVEEDKIDLSNAHLAAALPSNPAIDAERKDLIVFSKMPLLSYKIHDPKINLILNENKFDGNIINDDYFKNKKKLHYSIGAYAGLQSVNKQIKSDPMFTEYADIRNTSEKKINTFYFGVNFTVEKKNFLLQTGLEYNTIGEQNNYEAKSKQWLTNDEKVWDVYNKQIINVDTVYHFGIVNYNQTIVNVKDSTLLTKSDSVFIYHTDSNIVKANGKTTINYLEIPLMVGYQFKFGKVAIAPFAGISVGYFTKSQGMYINKTITGIEEINDAKLMTTFNFNYQLKLQLGYNINDNFMLTLTPQYRNNLISVSPKSNGISTKYSTLGASFGLSYKL